MFRNEMLVFISEPAQCDRRFQLRSVNRLKVKQTGQGCFKVDIGIFNSAVSPQAAGQACSGSESLTHIHRLLTHLAHLYSKGRHKKKTLLDLGAHMVSKITALPCEIVFLFSIREMKRKG